MDGDSLRGRAGAASEGFAEGVVAFVADANPVHGAQDDRLPRAQEGNASRPQPQIPMVSHRIIGQHGANRRSGIHVEGSHAQGRGGRRSWSCGLRSEEDIAACAQEANGKSKPDKHVARLAVPQQVATRQS